MRFPLRLLLAVLIASPAAILHAQAEPAQEEPAPDPGTQRQQQPTADSQATAVSDSQPAADDPGDAATEGGQDRSETSESGATRAGDRDAADAHETRAANVDQLPPEVRAHRPSPLAENQAARDLSDFREVPYMDLLHYELRLHEQTDNYGNDDDTYIRISRCSLDILRTIRQSRDSSSAQDDFQRCIRYYPSIGPMTRAYLWENFSDLLGKLRRVLTMD